MKKQFGKKFEPRRGKGGDKRRGRGGRNEKSRDGGHYKNDRRENEEKGGERRAEKPWEKERGPEEREGRDRREGKGGRGYSRGQKPWEKRERRAESGEGRAESGEGRAGSGERREGRDNRDGGYKGRGGDRREKKPWEKREGSRERGNDRGNDRGGDRREKKPWEKREGRGESGERRTGDERRDNRGGGSRREGKPWEKREGRNEKPWEKREGRSERPWEKREGRSEKPWEKREGRGEGNYRRKDYREKREENLKKAFDRSKNNSARTSGVSVPAGEGMIRLNKYLSNAGICSRREADKFIEAGTVKVNGKIITQLGFKVAPGDKVQFGDNAVRKEKTVYILMNKPKGYITTTDDERDRATVMELIEGVPERVYPVGRLDRNTSGLLLLTNDGELAKTLMHPKYRVAKVYHVILDTALKPDDLDKIREGLELEDGLIKPDDIAYVDGAETKREVGIEIHSGKNRIVRRIFEHLGYSVGKLDRVLYAGLTKKNLSRGKWRFLEDNEVRMLKRIK